MKLMLALVLVVMMCSSAFAISWEQVQYDLAKMGLDAGPEPSSVPKEPVEVVFEPTMPDRCQREIGD